MDEFEKELDNMRKNVTCGIKEQTCGQILAKYRAFKAKADGGLVAKVKVVRDVLNDEVGLQYATLKIAGRIVTALRAHEGGTK